MKKLFLACAVASLALTGASNAATTSSAAKGKARLDKMIEGRVAGKPVSCIPALIGNKLHVIDETAIVYDAGKTVYVARPQDPKSLDTNDILVINRFGSQLCRQDFVRTVDRVSGFTTGVVFLDSFVPYTKG